MLNVVVLQGRLTQDPEIKSTRAEKKVASFAIAVERDYRSRSGEKQTDFVSIEAWNQPADLAESYLSKGDMVVVKGPLGIQSWEDNAGIRRSRPVVTAEKIYLVLTSKSRPRDNGGYEPDDQYSGYMNDGFQEIGEDTPLPDF